MRLRVCDISCGSGHILLAAARRIGLALAIVRTGDDQPSPAALREATRDAIKNCIYGVDLNPLAVELCKVALWLEAHSPGEPLNFLDHHIKCGNAIVKDGLEQVIAAGGTINMAVRGIKWPGVANLVVSLVAISRGEWKAKCTLDGMQVAMISAFFEDLEEGADPSPLRENSAKMYQGSIPLGDGFFLTPHAASKLIALDPDNAAVIMPTLNAMELNSQPVHYPERYIINFYDWTENKARQYAEPFSIVEATVKPVRADSNRQSRKDRWWQYAERAAGLLSAVTGYSRCFVTANTTKYLNFCAFDPGHFDFNQKLRVLTTDRWDNFAIVQSTIHETWGRKYSGTLETRLSYSPRDCFDTFAFPAGLMGGASGEQRIASGEDRSASCEQRMASGGESDSSNHLPLAIHHSPAAGGSSSPHSPFTTHHSLASIGERYHEFRRDLMLRLWLGLTDIYNLFHAPDLERRLEALFKKRVANSEWRVVGKVPAEHMLTAGSLSLEDAIASIKRLRELHVELDYTVLAAYGWVGRIANSEQRVANGEEHGPSNHTVAAGGSSSSHHSPLTIHHSPEIELSHDFYAVETLPENDRTRYTISPESRKTLLTRLLILNHERAAEEAATQLNEHGKNKAPAKKNIANQSSKILEPNPEPTLPGTSRYPTPQWQAIPDKRGINFRRGAIMAKAVSRLSQRPQFGRTQMEKALCLTQHGLGIDLDLVFERYQNGPYTSEIHNLESLARKQEWFSSSAQKDGRGASYKPQSKIQGRIDAASPILGNQAERFEWLLDQLEKMDSTQAEIFATTFMVWHDLLHEGIESPNPTEIVTRFYLWHPEKAKFPDAKIRKCMQWLKDNEFIPLKLGPPTTTKNKQ